MNDIEKYIVVNALFNLYQRINSQNLNANQALEEIHKDMVFYSQSDTKYTKSIHINQHNELRKKLENINSMPRGEASQIVTEILKYIMDYIHKMEKSHE